MRILGIKASLFHLWMTLLWISLLAPTLIWWSESVLWVSLMSLYANVVGHWSAFQASHAEERLAKMAKSAKGERDHDRERGVRTDGCPGDPPAR